MTHEEYDEYMQMCEDVGWEVEDYYYRNQRCIRIRNGGGFDVKEYYEKENLSILSLQELKELIGVEKRIEVNTRIEFIKPRVFGGGIIEEVFKMKHHDMPNEWHKTYLGMDFGKEIIKTNKKSIMKNIKDTLKALTHSKEDKALIKAGLKDSELNWTYEAKEYADTLVQEERMAQDDFTEKMLKVAEARNEDCK